MKFHFEIINSKDSGSVYNVNNFARYVGIDSCQNMAEVLTGCQELHNDRLSLYSHKVKVSLGGDYQFLND